MKIYAGCYIPRAHALVVRASRKIGDTEGLQLAGRAVMNN